MNFIKFRNDEDLIDKSPVGYIIQAYATEDEMFKYGFLPFKDGTIGCAGSWENH